jgi:hypothetical protein
VFGFCNRRCYRLAPRIKGLKDRKVFVGEKPCPRPLVARLIGGTGETAAIPPQRVVLVRLKTPIETGPGVPFVILRNPAAARADNAPSRVSRTIGRLDRALSTLTRTRVNNRRAASDERLLRGRALRFDHV